MITSSLETDRLWIRRFHPNDVASVHSYMSDPNIIEHFPENLFSYNDTKNFVESNLNENAKNFALIQKFDDKLIGHVVFHEWFAPKTIEIGWVISPLYQSKGFASEAALQILAYGFETLSAHRIIATCQPENSASWRVMEKIRMRKEGHFLKCIFRRDRWIDEYFYAILIEEWKTS